MGARSGRPASGRAPCFTRTRLRGRVTPRRRGSMMGSRRVRLTMTATAVAAMLAASGASAQVSAADRETARSMMQEGRDLRDKGDLKGALQRFKAADDIMHVPTTSLEVA